jgi:hypothetical protein
LYSQPFRVQQMKIFVVLLMNTLNFISMKRERKEKTMLVRLTVAEYTAVKKKAEEMRCSNSELLRLTLKNVCYV